MGYPLWNQLWTISAVQYVSMAQAMFAVYFMSILLPSAELFEKTGTLTDSPLYYLASVSELGGVVGTSASAICMKYLGRRITYGAFVLPATMSWIMVYFVNNIYTMMAAIFLGAVSAGGTGTLGAIVSAEFSNPKYRGLFLTFGYLSPLLGIAIGVLITFFTHMYVVAILGLQFQIIGVLIVYFWPESPLWLAAKKRYEMCEKAFHWLRGTSEESLQELEEMINLQKSLDSKPKVKLSTGKKIVKYLMRFTKSDFLQPLGIMVAANMLMQITGREFMVTITPVLMDRFEHIRINFSHMTNIGTLLTTVASLILVRFMTRRSMIFSANSAAFFVLMAIFVQVFVMRIYTTIVDSKWLIVWFVVLYFILSSVGCSPLSIIIPGELFPSAHKGIGSAASSITSSIFRLAVYRLIRNYTELPDWSIPVIILVYVALMGGCLMVLYFKLPETKDKTLQEIEKYFRKGRFNFDRLGPQSNVEFELMES